ARRGLGRGRRDGQREVQPRQRCVEHAGGRLGAGGTRLVTRPADRAPPGRRPRRGVAHPVAGPPGAALAGPAAIAVIVPAAVTGVSPASAAVITPPLAVIAASAAGIWPARH